MGMTEEDMMMNGNSTEMPMTNDEVVDPASLVPTCEEIEESFCDAFGEDIGLCCLTDCTVEIKSLLDCVILATTGEDRSNCEVPTCPGPAPTETDTTTAPAASSAITTTRGAVVGAASLIVAAML